MGRQSEALEERDSDCNGSRLKTTRRKENYLLEITQNGKSIKGEHVPLTCSPSTSTIG
jgi:hypothetical protein